MNSQKLSQLEKDKIVEILSSNENYGLMFYLMYGKADISVHPSYAFEKIEKLKKYGMHQVNELDGTNFENFRSRLNEISIFKMDYRIKK